MVPSAFRVHSFPPFAPSQASLSTHEYSKPLLCPFSREDIEALGGVQLGQLGPRARTLNIYHPRQPSAH